jgi:DNA-binding beta-propeller fold protein YncE
MRIYLQTNDAERNEIIAFERRENGNGMPRSLGRFPTGGRGSGKPHLASQSSVVVREGRVLVTNAGSDEVSLFAERENGLELVATVASGGSAPTSVAVHGDYSLDGASLRPVSGSVADTRSEVCWAIASKDGRFVWVTNFGDGTISRYRVGADGSLELEEPVAASTNLGAKGVRDEALSADGRFLYALDADARSVFGWRVGASGELDPVGSFEGLPETVAGLAAG